MSSSDILTPGGVLVIDGEAMSLARSPQDIAEVTSHDLVTGRIAPETVLMLALRSPRRQRTGVEALATSLLADYPFYALAERFDTEAKKALHAALTPHDRILTLDPPSGAFEIAVADASTATLLETVFADLPANRPAGAEGDVAAARCHAKWRFGDVRRELGARLGRLARENARANRALRLAHMRCGDAALGQAAVGAGSETIEYLAVDDRAEARAAATALFPALPVHAPDALAAAVPGEIGVFLFTEVFEAGDAEATIATLRPVTALAARRPVVIALVRHDGTVHGEHGLLNGPEVSRLAGILQRLFEGPCEMRRIVTLAHKPFDALPGTTLVEFEVNR